MKILIGIDDTDNLETRGTGHHARKLGISLMEARLLDLHSVTRHQLLPDPLIPFTSHNSSACLEGESESNLQDIVDHCREFLLRESAFDSDAGLCIAGINDIESEIIDFGVRAKNQILKLEDAQSLAAKYNIFLDGYLNTRLGMIGSLAAVGLRAGGNDGRILWTNRLRDSSGTYVVNDFLSHTGIDRVLDMNGNNVPPDAILEVGEWCRPVMKDGMITLIAEKTNNNHNEYRPASKEYIKSISE